MPPFELWYAHVHRPLDARTSAQAIQRARAFLERYAHRYLNVPEADVMEYDPPSDTWTHLARFQLHAGNVRREAEEQRA